MVPVTLSTHCSVVVVQLVSALVHSAEVEGSSPTEDRNVRLWLVVNCHEELFNKFWSCDRCIEYVGVDELDVFVLSAANENIEPEGVIKYSHYTNS